jgi:hypothetical protein
MKQAPEPVRVSPLFDEDELAAAVELGCERSAALVRELMLQPPEGIVQPRYLTWTRRTPQGVLVTTDRAQFVVSPRMVDDFCFVLNLMIRGEFGGGMQGSC